MTSPKDKTNSVAKLPVQPIGKELRDSFEKVRNEPIPEALRQLILDLKLKEQGFSSDQGDTE